MPTRRDNSVSKVGELDPGHREGQLILIGTMTSLRFSRQFEILREVMSINPNFNPSSGSSRSCSVMDTWGFPRNSNKATRTDQCEASKQL
eukprot:scaffold2557_cov121-Cylindrotheca_fusiformis.AAC.8